MKFKKVILSLFLILNSVLTYGQTQKYKDFQEVTSHLINALECKNWIEADSSDGLSVRTLPISQLNLSKIPGIKIDYSPGVITVNLPKTITVFGSQIQYFQITKYDGQKQDESYILQFVRLDPGNFKELIKSASSTLASGFNRVDAYNYISKKDQREISLQDESEGDVPGMIFNCFIRTGAKGVLAKTEDQSDFFESYESFQIASEKMKKDQLEKERIAQEEENIKNEAKIKAEVSADMQSFKAFKSDVFLFEKITPVALAIIGFIFFITGFILFKYRSLKIDAKNLSLFALSTVFIGAAIFQFFNPIYLFDKATAEKKWIDMYNNGNVLSSKEHHTQFITLGEMIAKMGSKDIALSLSEVYKGGMGLVSKNEDMYKYYYANINAEGGELNADGINNYAYYTSMPDFKGDWMFIAKFEGFETFLLVTKKIKIHNQFIKYSLKDVTQTNIFYVEYENDCINRKTRTTHVYNKDDLNKEVDIVSKWESSQGLHASLSRSLCEQHFKSGKNNTENKLISSEKESIEIPFVKPRSNAEELFIEITKRLMRSNNEQCQGMGGTMKEAYLNLQRHPVENAEKTYGILYGTYQPLITRLRC